MGANYLSLRFKNVKLTELRMTELRAAVDALTAADIPETVDVANVAEWQQDLRSCLDVLPEMPKWHADIVMTIDSRYMDTGGSSWGDPPTESYRIFDQLYDAPKIMELIDRYFIEDYPEEALKSVISNEGERVELHVFQHREYTEDELRYIEEARKRCIDGDLEIDDDTVVSKGEDGAYVLAWVWVDSKAVYPDEDESKEEA